jgi:hypothetical protein
MSIVDYEPFRLSNGESLLLGHWVAPKPLAKGVFHRKRVHGYLKLTLVLENTTTRSDWKEILGLAGATISVKPITLSGPCDFVIGDKIPSKKEEEKLKLKKVKVFSTEFVIQSLIHQDLLNPYDHPRFLLTQ